MTITALIILTFGVAIMVPRIRENQKTIASVNAQIASEQSRIVQMQQEEQATQISAGSNARAQRRYSNIIAAVQQTKTIQEALNSLYVAIDRSRYQNHLQYVNESQCTPVACRVGLTGTYREIIQFLRSMYRSPSLVRLARVTIHGSTHTGGGRLTAQFKFVPFIINAAPIASAPPNAAPSTAPANT